jgi:hypothetical protein
MIVKTNDGAFFRVEPADGIDHAWLGVAVKRTKDGFAPKAGKQRKQLVRKAGAVVVQQS